jgi:transposase
MRRLLYLQPDFAESYKSNAVTEACKNRGHIVLMLPKAHPELNSAELLWAKAKQETRDVNPGVRECLC